MYDSDLLLGPPGIYRDPWRPMVSICKTLQRHSFRIRRFLFTEVALYMIRHISGSSCRSSFCSWKFDAALVFRYSVQSR